jgi:hypothetical protein
MVTVVVLAAATVAAAAAVAIDTRPFHPVFDHPIISIITILSITIKAPPILKIPFRHVWL